MGDYRWKTYAEVNILSQNFGKGLREFGNEPGKNVVIFAETRAEWMIAAHGLFKQNIPLVTIYATLGDDAIAHGINETEVNTVITSLELLPKFKKILDKTPLVKTLIYMEDQLNTLENTEGYKEGVEIIKFSEVLKKGETSSIGKYIFINESEIYYFSGPIVENTSSLLLKASLKTLANPPFHVADVFPSPLNFHSQ